MVAPYSNDDLGGIPIKGKIPCFVIEILASLILIGVTLAGLLFFIFDLKEVLKTGREWEIHKIPAACAILIYLVVLGIAAYCLLPQVIYVAQSYQEIEPIITNESIYSLNSINGISGSFFLGCGEIGSVSYYQFYYKNNGAYYLGKVPADGTGVYMDENMSPYLQKTEWHYISYHPDGTTSDGGVAYSKGTQYALHVPGDTIKQTFNLGA
jgi:hypothetical protein